MVAVLRNCVIYFDDVGQAVQPSTKIAFANISLTVFYTALH